MDNELFEFTDYEYKGERVHFDNKIGFSEQEDSIGIPIANLPNKQMANARMNASAYERRLERQEGFVISY